jgi:hypothetical protein
MPRAKPKNLNHHRLIPDGAAVVSPRPRPPRLLPGRDASQRAGGEPALAELLDDPLIKQVMESYGVKRADLIAQLERQRRALIAALAALKSDR